MTFTVVFQWHYDRLRAAGKSVEHLMPFGSWAYDKNDVRPEALTVRLHERWSGTSFMRMPF